MGIDIVIALLVAGFGLVAILSRWRLDRLEGSVHEPRAMSQKRKPNVLDVQCRFRPGDVCYASSPYRTAQKKWKDHEDRNAAMIKAGAIYDPMRNGAPYYGGAVTMAYPSYQYSTCVASQIGNFQLVMPTPKPPSMPGPGPYGD